MRLVPLGVAAAIAVSMSGVAPAFANADDAAWIKRCVADNADQKQSATVIAAYCSCMTNKMPEKETLSVTAWEKTHVTEQEACSKEAGWK